MTYIPLNIFQTWHTKKLPPKMNECIQKLKNDNPEFKHYLYDEKMCRTFIKNNFNKDVLNAYDKLIPKAYKSDLWRYCILYTYGGVYLDVKFQCINNFKFISLTDKEYFVRDVAYSGSGIYNALIICKPKNIILLKAINKIVENCKNEYYGSSSLEPTGPLLLKNISNINTDLFLEGINHNVYIKYNNKYILKNYDEYRDEQKKLSNIPNYNVYWRNKKMYNNKNYINKLLLLLALIILILVVFILVNKKL